MWFFTPRLEEKLILEGPRAPPLFDEKALPEALWNQSHFLIDFRSIFDNFEEPFWDNFSDKNDVKNEARFLRVSGEPQGRLVPDEGFEEVVKTGQDFPHLARPNYRL